MQDGPAAWLARRISFGLLTLFLLSVVVFAGGQLLPGDVGRAILGPLADPRAVAALDRQLGADRPAVMQYLDWVLGILHGNLGQSLEFRAPVSPFILGALAHSLRLAAVALVMVVPLSIGAGVLAALRRGTLIDRVISLAGLSLTVIPEFVTSILVILLFGVWLRWLPISATWRAGTGLLGQLDHLILPAIPLVVVLFGYIARMARAGTVEALEADYTRTAILKGLSGAVVIRRHVLRNALLPTITVIAAQTSYLVGGLVVVESLFRYQGIGSLILAAAHARDFPMLEAGVLSVGAMTIAVTLLADALTAFLTPAPVPGEGG
ncbi:MAG: ABC transporter permease [Rhodospirillales bacterium]|nr:ABC transporter permease [Rhodospirillales bacterium]